MDARRSVISENVVLSTRGYEHISMLCTASFDNVRFIQNIWVNHHVLYHALGTYFIFSRLIVLGGGGSPSSHA